MFSSIRITRKGNQFVAVLQVQGFNRTNDKVIEADTREELDAKIKELALTEGKELPSANGKVSK
jgi:hypothetical protein